MSLIVYLAGPIAGCTYNEATDWRAIAASDLLDYDVKTLDPMRAKKALFGQTIARDHRQYAQLGGFYTGERIMLRDYTDVCRCDALLVNLLGARDISVGTAMELAWAYHMRKLVVAAIEEDNPHLSHPMVAQALPIREATLEDAVDALCIMLGV